MQYSQLKEIELYNWKKKDFIPLCTKNVFLNLYSSADNQPYYWSTSDKEAYVEAIKQVIEKFKNKKLK